MLLAVGLGALVLLLETIYLPRLGLTMQDLHTLGEQAEAAFADLRHFVVLYGVVVIAVLLAAVVFGPGAGFAVGAVADIIGGVLAGYAINPLITLGAGAIGLVAGFAWQKLSSLSTNLRLAASVLLGHFVGSALRALESVTHIRIPDYRPTCSCVFDLLIKHQTCLQAVGLGFIANLNIPGS